jgi:hypothetical protein
MFIWEGGLVEHGTEVESKTWDSAAKRGERFEGCCMAFGECNVDFRWRG